MSLHAFLLDASGSHLLGDISRHVASMLGWLSREVERYVPTRSDSLLFEQLDVIGEPPPHFPSTSTSDADRRSDLLRFGS